MPPTKFLRAGGVEIGLGPMPGFLLGGRLQLPLIQRIAGYHGRSWLKVTTDRRHRGSARKSPQMIKYTFRYKTWVDTDPELATNLAIAASTEMPNLDIGNLSLGHGPGCFSHLGFCHRCARDLDPATFRRGHMIGRGPQRGIITTESLKIYFTQELLVKYQMRVSPSVSLSYVERRVKN